MLIPLVDVPSSPVALVLLQAQGLFLRVGHLVPPPHRLHVLFLWREWLVAACRVRGVLGGRAAALLDYGLAEGVGPFKARASGAQVTVAGHVRHRADLTLDAAAGRLLLGLGLLLVLLVLLVLLGLLAGKLGGEQRAGSDRIQQAARRLHL